MEYYNKIYTALKLRSGKVLTDNDELFDERLHRLSQDEPQFSNYEDDIKVIKSKYSTYEEFEEEWNDVKSKITEIIDSVKENIRSLCETYVDEKPNVNYERCTLCGGHTYLSIDIKEAWVHLLIRHCQLSGYNSWESIVSQFTNNRLLIDSKAFRQTVWMKSSNLTKRRNIFVPLLNEVIAGEIIQGNFKDVSPSLVLTDEIVYDITSNPNKFDFLIGECEENGIPLHIKKFKYSEIGWISDNYFLSVFPIREYSDCTYMPYKSCNIFWLIYDYYHSIPTSENDYKVQLSSSLIVKSGFNSPFIVGEELEKCKKKYKII